MKPRLPWAPLLALVAVTAAPAATFEGKVEMKISSNGKSAQTLTYQMREGQMRVDVPTAKGQGGAVMIMDAAKQQMLIIMPAQKMYMVRSLASPSAPPMQAEGPSGQSGATGETPSLNMTTEHDTILGYDCVKYTVQSKSDASVTELWATDQLGNFSGLGGMGGGAAGGRMGMGAPAAPQGWEKALMGKGFFPLRVVGKDSGGKEKFRLEVVSVEKSILADSLFAPPDGYRELNLGSMMGGMMPH